MVKCWEAWPWRLLGLFTHNARETAHALFDAPLWQLDAGFSCKLWNLAGSAEELLSDEWSGFIRECFQRLLLSNAFVEDMFAHMNQWLRPVSKPIKHHLLQAKSCLATWSWATVAKRKRANRPHAFQTKQRAKARLGQKDEGAKDLISPLWPSLAKGTSHRTRQRVGCRARVCKSCNS